MVTNQKRFRRVCREIDDYITFIFDYIYLYRLEEVVSPEADTVEQIETDLVAACNILHPSVVVVETIAEVRSQRYLVRHAVGDSRDYGYAELVEIVLNALSVSDTILQTANNEKREIASLGKGVAGIRHDAVGVDIRERHIWHAVLAAIAIACMTITEGDGNAEVTAQTVANIRSNSELHSGVVTAIGVIRRETYLATNPYLSIHSSRKCKSCKR